MNTMSLTPTKIHLGIYGVCVVEGKVLMIKKGRGPYEGLWDLPGGKIEPGESFVEALTREFDEETGVRVLEQTPLCVSEYHCNWVSADEEKAFHHVALYYAVALDSTIIKPGPDGHDSNGAEWVAFPIAEEDVSPIAREALKRTGLL